MKVKMEMASHEIGTTFPNGVEVDLAVDWDIDADGWTNIPCSCIDDDLVAYMSIRGYQLRDIPIATEDENCWYLSYRVINRPTVGKKEIVVDLDVWDDGSNVLWVSERYRGRFDIKDVA